VLAALKLLGGVPVWAWLLAAALAWGGWHRWRAIDARAEFQRAEQQAAAERAADAASVASETTRRLQAIQKEADRAQETAKAARADADAARTAEQRLRARIAAAQASAGAGDPAASGGSSPASEAAGVLADVLGRCVERVRRLAEYADNARIAGETCEASYYTLTPNEGRP
jgi:Protein of unknown function (DUF2514)